MVETSKEEASGLRVLIVDDDDDFLEGLQTLLEIDGHTVRACPDASSTIEVASTFLPQLAILDLGLPDADGFDLARHLRESLTRADTMLVAMSGFGGPEVIQRAQDAGFDHHLLKPVSLDSIRQIISAFAQNVPAKPWRPSC
ncbi:MAG: response regulator [Deltaproteobacteria bacterium]|nr:response regulator [Deltaproteobacteria bacterium]